MNLLKKREYTTNIFLYLFGFILLWEWLRPLKVLTDTGNMVVFLLFISISLILSYFQLRFVYAFLIKTLFIIYVLHRLFFEGSILHIEWIHEWIQDISYNIGYVFDADWNSLSNNFRTLLLFIVLWLMTYLIQYWLVVRKKIFIFFLMTLIYITVLDTFTPYEADGAIVRTVIAGFAIMGMLTFYRLIERETISRDISLSRKWMMPLTVMIVVCVAVGLAAPKQDPIWPDPVPFIKSLNQESGVGVGGTQKVGYGSDDSNLGGPFIGDDQVVFTAETDSKHYWKIESKIFYTGKGWVVYNENQEDIHFQQNENVPLEVYNLNGVTTTKETSLVQLTFRDQPFVVYPLGITKIKGDNKDSFRLEPLKEKINRVSVDDNDLSKRFSVEYNRAKYSMKALSEPVDMDIIEETELYRKYTQLPHDLPYRIKELALEITSGKKTWFDKALAIEGYFSSNGYIYDQKEVAVPAPDQDYVDQFLFETKQGYCDNFSTSMAVMLRTIGIPTRWVKGYTEGEFKGAGKTKLYKYEITNNNAHSWVEVYFPQVGWVPFEPTQGFNNNVSFNYDLEDNKETQTETTEEEAKTEVQKPNQPQKDLLEENNDSSITSVWGKIKTIISSNFKMVLITLIIVVLISSFIYTVRQKWIPHVLILLYKRSKKDIDFVKAYLALLKQLNRIGLKRKPGQTLRDYANYIDQYFSSREMGKLTTQYEQYLYKGEVEEETWIELRELWENLIKKTKG